MHWRITPWIRGSVRALLFFLLLLLHPWLRISVNESKDSLSTKRRGGGKKKERGGEFCDDEKGETKERAAKQQLAMRELATRYYKVYTVYLLEMLPACSSGRAPFSRASLNIGPYLQSLDEEISGERSAQAAAKDRATILRLTFIE